MQRDNRLWRPVAPLCWSLVQRPAIFGLYDCIHLCNPRVWDCVPESGQEDEGHCSAMDQDSCPLKGLCSYTVNSVKKFQFIKFCTARSVGLHHGLDVPVFVWLKYHNVKWLAQVRSMRQHWKYKDIPSIATLNWPAILDCHVGLPWLLDRRNVMVQPDRWEGKPLGAGRFLRPICHVQIRDNYANPAIPPDNTKKRKSHSVSAKVMVGGLAM
jgi:hypothetical protein